MISRAEAEFAAGIERYATDSSPCSARIRSSPEDFRVEELMSIEGMISEERPHYYPLYRVEKRSIDTLHMAEKLSASLHSKVSFGGLKDKRALAVQYATPTSTHSSRVQEVVDDKFTARLVGYVPSPMGRRVMVGNKFEVTLRDCCDKIGKVMDNVMKAGRARRLPNFYGLQRFGSMGRGTHMIGRAIVTRKFDEAVSILLVGTDGASASAQEMKAAMKEERFEYLERLLPLGRDVERRVASELVRHPGDWIRAIRSVPLRLRRLYVHAFQSYLFNRSLSRALSRGEDIATYLPGDNWARVSADGLVASKVFGVKDTPDANAVPMAQLVGYAFRDYGTRFDTCVKETMKIEGVSPSQFFIKELQEVSSEGGFRRPHLALNDASWTVDGRSARMTFTLAKGQYATSLLREIIKPDDPLAAGFP